MTPEKIYLNKHPFTGELHDKWLQNKLDDSDIEYTRTDAIIEKACEWLREQNEMIGISFTEDFIIRFKNYMKGE